MKILKFSTQVAARTFAEKFMEKGEAAVSDRTVSFNTEDSGTSIERAEFIKEQAHAFNKGYKACRKSFADGKISGDCLITLGTIIFLTDTAVIENIDTVLTVGDIETARRLEDGLLDTYKSDAYLILGDYEGKIKFEKPDDLELILNAHARNAVIKFDALSQIEA